MATQPIVEPRVIGCEAVLPLPLEIPDYLVQAIYQVNSADSELILALPNGQRAVLSPGTDLSTLDELAQSDELMDAVEDALNDGANSTIQGPVPNDA